MSLTHGALVRFGGAMQNGQQLDCRWKCWSSSPHNGAIRWDLRSAIPVTGLAEKNNSSYTLYRHMSEQWVRWKAVLHRFDLDTAEHIGESRKAHVLRCGGWGGGLPIAQPRHVHSRWALIVSKVRSPQGDIFGDPAFCRGGLSRARFIFLVLPSVSQTALLAKWCRASPLDAHSSV